MSTLNPQIRVIKIGTRSLKEVQIYPLSLADQFRVSDIIADGVATFQQRVNPPSEEESDIISPYAENSALKEAEIFKVIIELVEQNLMTILKMVCEDEISLDDISNDQFADICEIIYEVNFENSLGKFKAMIDKAKTRFQSKKPSLKSSPQPLTDSNISSDSTTTKAE